MIDFPPSAQDVAEWAALAALALVVLSVARWFYHEPRRGWHIALPALAWIVNEALFLAAVVSMELGGVRIAINVWSLICIAQGLATLAWYFWIFGRDNH